MATVSREKARALTADIEKAIAGVFASHGMDSPVVKTTYGDYYRVTVQASPVVEGLNGVNEATPEAVYFTKFGWSWWPIDGRGVLGAPVQLVAPLGTRFVVKGVSYVFLGIAPKRRKFPIVAKNEQTGQTVFHTENVVPILNEAVAS